MMTIERPVIVWRFWLQWVLLTILGYSVGILLSFVLGSFLLGNIMMGIGVGAGVGFMQWLALRRFVYRSGWWVLANIAGLTVSLCLYAVVIINILGYPFDLGWSSGALGWALAFVLGGALVGFSQHWILRHHVCRSIWWVLVSAVGWALSVLGLAIAADVMLGSAVAGIILGTLTGGALVWLLRQPIASEVS
jgi:hypothetical protein